MAYTADDDTGDILPTSNAGVYVTSASATATTAQWAHALDRVTYDNSSDAPDETARTVAIVVDDSSSASAANTRTLEVAGVDDTPIATASAGTVAWTEADNAVPAPVSVYDALAVSDLDSANLASATVAITDGLIDGEDVLAFTAQDGITGDYADGTLTLTGSAPLSARRTALRSVTYTNTSQTPDTGDRTVSFTVSDGHASSAAATRSVTVAAVNDTPTLAAGDGTVSWTEPDNGDAAPVVLDPDLAVADLDHDDLQTATVTITDAVAAEDVLAFTDQNGIAGDYDADAGVLALSGEATKAEYRDALRSVTYDNSSETPTGTSRTVAFAASDGVATSNSAVTTMALTSTDDTPVVSLSGDADPSYTEQADPVAIDDDLTVTDADDTDLEGATVIIGAGRATGDTLSFTPVDGITGDYTADDGTLELTGTASVVDYQSALQSIKYDNALDDPSDAKRTISLVVDDGRDQRRRQPRRDLHRRRRRTGRNAFRRPRSVLHRAGRPRGRRRRNPGERRRSRPAHRRHRRHRRRPGAGDTLSFTPVDGIAGEFTADDGTLVLTGTASKADYRTVLRSVKYANDLDDPSAATRTISVTVTQGSADSAAVTRSLTFTAVDDAPQLTTMPAALAYAEGQAATPIDPDNLTVADADSASLTGATAAIVSGLAAAEDVLGFTAQNGVTGTYDAETGVLALTGHLRGGLPQRPALRHLPQHQHGSVGCGSRGRLPRAEQRRGGEHGRAPHDRHRPQRPREHDGADRARDGPPGARPSRHAGRVDGLDTADARHTLAALCRRRLGLRRHRRRHRRRVHAGRRRRRPPAARRRHGDQPALDRRGLLDARRSGARRRERARHRERPGLPQLRPRCRDHLDRRAGSDVYLLGRRRRVRAVFLPVHALRPQRRRAHRRHRADGRRRHGPSR